MKDIPLPDVILLSFISYACIPFQAELQADALDVYWGDGSSLHHATPGKYLLRYTYQTEGLQHIFLTGKNISFLKILGEPITAIRLHRCPHLQSLEGIPPETFRADSFFFSPLKKSGRKIH